ncbi:hypothetical protein E2562_038871 [Oryza meyeriana var. granulata]|uniref:RING-type E3 ubiquitin transferase n=1 Tax=Oryza meyeriana var. granulata TaxID=110450 RepID=A0A6G1FGV4_9ORYZ|nr:hypothetical protein E2562_038871 [Oryza meyeriana var. granulata]
MDAAGVRRVLRRYVSSCGGGGLACTLAEAVYGGEDGVLAQLHELKAWFEEQTLFHFYSASILLGSDAMRRRHPEVEYVLGAGLGLLLQHLAESDPSRNGTPPAKKEAVEALPTVKIEEVVSCSVCLDDLELGSQAKQMPCEHKFHSCCIVPWLELHSSCPVCRFELPSDETKDLNEPSNIGRVENSHEEVRADGPGNVSESSNRPWAVVPWLNELFSTREPQNVGVISTDQQPPHASGANPNAGQS